MIVVELYGQDGCCLCDEAREILERVRADRPFELVERDIRLDDAVHRRYLERIPVVVIDGEEWCDLRVPEAAFRARLAAAESGSARGGDDLESGR
jgi:hypothetical protein